MKLVILLSFLLVLTMFSSGIETSHLDNVHHKIKEKVVMNARRIDLETDYSGPHLRPPVPSRPPKALLHVGNVHHKVKEEVAMNGRRIDFEMDYTGPHPRPPGPPHAPVHA
ncbi:PREDICTED: uncharacterized protein LOC104736451 [Camelina sativa]|uniref:Uncharacterized protein LOC104736451 n=1 Tax=Camelina sativa TaxID=90675 RepID=A0ABM0VDZ3_CAMSA|nr:PREDICTED: uncharacterized protein LOC104736451 [Camelina sativa]